MRGLLFEEQAPVIASDPKRADVACFVGFVGRRESQAVPPEVKNWLQEGGWGSSSHRDSEPGIDDLLDIPVPIDTWESFDRLFRWETRTPGKSSEGATYLGAAVRSFFAQGGRRCYVVRVGDPWQRMTPQSQRLNQINRLIPGYRPEGPSRFEGSPVDRESWKGIGHLFGLPDVSFLCLPDLPDAVGVDPREIALPPPPPPLPEQFVECSNPEPPPPPDRQIQFAQAPRCDEEGYFKWSMALRSAGDFLSRQMREVQLVAAIPIPLAGTEAERHLLGFLTSKSLEALAFRLNADERSGLSSAFVQLVYPWAQTPGSEGLPERLENPDGVLAGLLARNALTRGAFRSTAGLHLGDVYGLFPLLGRDQTETLPRAAEKTVVSRYTLAERVSLFGPTPRGHMLLSDVTTCLDEAYRHAGVNRLVSAIVRAARGLGEEILFESSGEVLWERLRRNLNDLLTGLLNEGALQGAAADDAFQVRCDRTTMTHADAENGRVIAELDFQAAVPIERITVVLSMSEGGVVSAASTGSTPR